MFFFFTRLGIKDDAEAIASAIRERVISLK